MPLGEANPKRGSSDNDSEVFEPLALEELECFFLFFLSPFAVFFFAFFQEVILARTSARLVETAARSAGDLQAFTFFFSSLIFRRKAFFLPEVFFESASELEMSEKSRPETSTAAAAAGAPPGAPPSATAGAAPGGEAPAGAPPRATS